MVLLPLTLHQEERSRMNTMGYLLHTVSGARRCSEPHVCVTIISLLLGFEVAQSLTFFFYYYFFPSAHTWCVEGGSCTDLASSCKSVRTSHSLNERSTVRVDYVICGSDPTRRVSYVSELQFEIRGEHTKGEQRGKRSSVILFAGRRAQRAKGFDKWKGSGLTKKFRACIKWQNNRKCGSTKQQAN